MKEDKDSPLGPRGRIQVRRVHELLQAAWDYAAIHSATHSTAEWSSRTQEHDPCGVLEKYASR